MNATIEIDGLRKRFGLVQALDGMTFTVHPGQVTGFVGPNGAGKSTTMRVVGLDAPDAVTATIGGRPYHSLQNPLWERAGHSRGLHRRAGARRPSLTAAQGSAPRSPGQSRKEGPGQLPAE
jgi:ABC-type branched-subunit amino acid transport system ATPase component